MTGKPFGPSGEAIQALYERYGRSALAHARTQTDLHTAEDAVQEAFLRLMLYTQPQSRSIDLSYVLAIVRNEIRRAKRAQREQLHCESEVPSTPDEGTSAWPIEVGPLLAGLSGQVRTTLELTCVRGLDSRRAAQAMGLAERAVTRQRTVAIKTLRRAATAFLERSHKSQTCAARPDFAAGRRALAQ